MSPIVINGAEETHAQPLPERAHLPHGESVQRAAPLFARHHAALYWCRGVDNGASFVTLCNGRFQLDDATVIVDAPAQARCKRCEMVASVQRRVGSGLAELAANAAEPAVIEWDEIGGEG